MQQTAAAGRTGVLGAAPGKGWRLTIVVGYAVLTAALVALAATQGLVGVAAGVLIAAFIVLLAVLGSLRTATLALMGAFATAPMYKGLAPAGAQVTPTDVLFVIGFALLLPHVINRRVSMPVSYVFGVSGIAIFGAIASTLSEESFLSFFALVLWLVVLVPLPIAFALWMPSDRIIELLCWSYVAGHMVSWVGGMARGGVTTDGRYFGLTTHPNYFGQAAIMSIGLLLYLLFRYKTPLLRLAVLGAIGLCGVTILLSGSRGATAVAAVLVLMIPIVERSAITGFIFAIVGAIFLAALPLVVEVGSGTSAIDRILGQGSASGSNQARTDGLQSGVDRFWDSPLFGDGLIDLFDIHNNFLEVVVGIGLFGLVAYLLVLYAFARPLLGDSPYRRLCYAAWIYIGWGAIVPSLYDRGVWAPIALSVVAVVTTTGRRPGDDGGDPVPDGAAGTDSDVPATTPVGGPPPV